MQAAIFAPEVQHVKIPKANLLGEAGQGFEYLTQMLAQERVLAAICFPGTARTAFDLTLEYVKERRTFSKPIGAFQNTRFKMAQMRAELDMAQIHVDQCVMLLNDACIQMRGSAGFSPEPARSCLRSSDVGWVWTNAK